MYVVDDFDEDPIDSVRRSTPVCTFVGSTSVCTSYTYTCTLRHLHVKMTSLDLHMYVTVDDDFEELSVRRSKYVDLRMYTTYGDVYVYVVDDSGDICTFTYVEVYVYVTVDDDFEENPGL